MNSPPSWMVSDTTVHSPRKTKKSLPETNVAPENRLSFREYWSVAICIGTIGPLK